MAGTKVGDGRLQAGEPEPDVPRSAQLPPPVSRRVLLPPLRHLVTQLGCTHGAGRQGEHSAPLGRPWMESHRPVCWAVAARGLGAAEPGYSARGTPIAPAQGARGRRPAGYRGIRAGLSPQTVPQMSWSQPSTTAHRNDPGSLVDSQSAAGQRLRVPCADERGTHIEIATIRLLVRRITSHGAAGGRSSVTSATSAKAQCPQ